jgi:hypothetical protein
MNLPSPRDNFLGGPNKLSDCARAKLNGRTESVFSLTDVVTRIRATRFASLSLS